MKKSGKRKKKNQKGNFGILGWMVLIIIVIFLIDESGIWDFVTANAFRIIAGILFIIVIWISVAIRKAFHVTYTDTGFSNSVPSSHLSLNKDFDRMDGHSFEYWCANLLRLNGFEDVYVTQGSNDQGVDITAKKDGYRYAIQCKRYSKRLGNTPVQEVASGRAIYRCNYAVVMTNNYFTEGAERAALANNVQLWDRGVILSMISNASSKHIPQRK